MYYTFIYLLYLLLYLFILFILYLFILFICISIYATHPSRFARTPIKRRHRLLYKYIWRYLVIACMCAVRVALQPSCHDFNFFGDRGTCGSNPKPPTLSNNSFA